MTLPPASSAAPADHGTTRTAATTVAVFVGTRADLGPLSPVIEALEQSPDIALRLLTGVMYAADDLAAALPDLLTPLEWRERVTPLAEPMSDVTVETQLEQGAVLARGTGQALARLEAEVLVVLGDRWELLYVVPSAFLLGVPIVHLHGGEVTEGAVDERVRHAVSKLADQHCAASADAAARLVQMGEPVERVHVTGAPGLDRLAAATPLPDDVLARLVGLPEVRRPLGLFTYHPPTADGDAPVGRWAREAAEATLDECGTVIATYPGMDHGREEILATLSELAAAEPERFAFVEALGRDYPSVLAGVDVVVGNSSSGVIEAATVHTAGVDIGDRQLGRLRGGNVLHSAEGADAVREAVRTVLQPAWQARVAKVANPYGAGDASRRIVDIVRSAPSGSRRKPFVTLDERADAYAGAPAHPSTEAVTDPSTDMRGEP